MSVAGGLLLLLGLTQPVLGGEYSLLQCKQAGPVKGDLGWENCSKFTCNSKVMSCPSNTTITCGGKVICKLQPATCPEAALIRYQTLCDNGCNGNCKMCAENTACNIDCNIAPLTATAALQHCNGGGRTRVVGVSAISILILPTVILLL